VRPDQEHAARTLAQVVIDGYARSGPSPGLEGVLAPTLRLDVQALVRGMSRQVMIDSAEIARLCSAEWERQAGEIDLDKSIRDAVAKHIQIAHRDMDHIIETRLKFRVEQAVDALIGDFATQTAKRIADRLIDAAVKAER
jgi:hypothetical protein